MGPFWASWGDAALVTGQVGETETRWDVLVALESEVSPGQCCWRRGEPLQRSPGR